MLDSCAEGGCHPVALDWRTELCAARKGLLGSLTKPQVCWRKLCYLWHWSKCWPSFLLQEGAPSCPLPRVAVEALAFIQPETWSSSRAAFSRDGAGPAGIPTLTLDVALQSRLVKALAKHTVELGAELSEFSSDVDLGTLDRLCSLLHFATAPSPCSSVPAWPPAEAHLVSGRCSTLRKG